MKSSPTLYVFFCSIFVVLLCTAEAPAQRSWRLIYENDAQGKTLRGNKNALIKAVRKGEVVRIYWSQQSATVAKRKVEHAAEAKFLTILSDETVLAQIDPIIGQTPGFEEQQIQFKENLEWSMIASSNGKCDHLMRNPISGEIINHQIRNRGIKWFVKIE